MADCSVVLRCLILLMCLLACCLYGLDNSESGNINSIRIAATTVGVAAAAAAAAAAAVAVAVAIWHGRLGFRV